MRISEWIALLYFAYLLTVALLKAPWPMRQRAATLSALCALWVLTVTFLPDTRLLGMLHDWMPGAFLLAGYWLSGLFFVAPMPSIEAWCEAFDRTVMEASGLNAFAARGPRLALEALEFAYVSCFLFVPACVAIVYLTQPALTDRAWAMVLLAEFGAFGMLPWIQTRPPRAIETAGPMDTRPLTMRHVNRFMVKNTSILVNTLPSGHVAGSLSAALALYAAAPSAGVTALAITGAIAVSVVIGRYHYAVDAITGVGVAFLAWGIVNALT